MKKIITSLGLGFLLLVSPAIFSQTAHPFELGFNVGGAWLKSDVKMKKVGGGWSATFGQTYCMNQTSPLLWGWRFRYLNATTYGQDSKRSYGIANNTVFNNPDDTVLNYQNNGGFVYQNYKTHIDEVSVELLLGANKLRQKTNLYPYIFGGAGLVKAAAKTNQLNDKNQRYDYSKIDSSETSSSSQTLTQLNNMYDGTYETLADGNTHPKWKFMPSFGVGLGYEVVKGFSIGLEHKVTWAFNDVLDGQRWSSSNQSTGDNDMYHYTSFWIKFSFGRGKKSSGNATTTTNTNTTGTTNYAGNTTSVPSIVFTNPASDPFSVSQPAMNISGTISSINTSSDMTMTVNGTPVSGFTYNASSHVFNYPATLQSGANTFIVTAANSVGSTNASATVIYSQAVVVPEIAPVVKILSPVQNPFTTNKNYGNVTGTVQNISSKEQMKIIVNGVETTNFSFNPSSHAFDISTNLILGANSFVISASNQAGNDSKTATVILKSNAALNTIPAAPVISIIDPYSNPFNTRNSLASISANILNVASIGQIAVTYNGGPVPTNSLNFNAVTHQLKFNLNLIQGANTIIISAANASGNDSKTATIIYEKSVEALASAPVISIINPSANPFSTHNSLAAIEANVLNINSIGQIVVTFNGAPVPANTLSFNAALHQIKFNVNLIQGANTVIISATNAGGNDSKTATVIYEKRVEAQVLAPVISITNPASNPLNTTRPTAAINGSILNITSAGQISVTLNGTPLATNTLNYNTASKQLAFTVNLIEGANTIVVSATNAGGSDSKTETIIYSKQTLVSPPLITITSPTSNPYNTTVNSILIKSNISNVTSLGQISVTLNGNPIASNALNYNAGSHELTFNTNLIQGSNTVVISATNAGGNDSKTAVIIYAPPIQVASPVITITSPSASPYTASANPTAINATILNVTNPNQISVTLNGAASTAFTFNSASQQFSMNANLVAGANTIVISATNQGGSDSKTVTVNYAAPQPPVVSFINPGTANSTTNSPAYAVVARALNVNSTQINVKVNGVSITNFLFQASTKRITFTANLIEGNNSILVSATNAVGSDNKTVSINYTKPINTSSDTIHHMPNSGADDDSNSQGGTPTKPPTGNQGKGGGIEVVGGNTPKFAKGPMITLITPATNSVTTLGTNYTVIANVKNINPTGITVKINGVPFTAYTYDTTSHQLTVPVTLNDGANTVEIIAASDLGNKSETVTITTR